MLPATNFWNIFVEELSTILSHHEVSPGTPYQLGNLFGLSVNGNVIMNPKKVQMIIDSITNGKSATLNARELTELAQRLGFTTDEVRSLRLALFAEAIRVFILNRARRELDIYALPNEEEAKAFAYEIGRLTFDLLEKLYQNGASGVSMKTRDIIDRVREALGIPATDALKVTSALGESSIVDEAIAAALEPASERYMQGSLWLEAARQMPERPQRLAMATQALILLNGARALAEEVAQGTAQQRDWLALIDMEIVEARSLG